MVGCWCFASHRQQRQLTLLLIGLDNAGKTSILNHFKGDSTEVTPTFGFSSTTISAAGCRLQLFDLGGGKNIRRIWKVYTSEVHGVVFVVDAADRSRLDESREALQQILQTKQLAGKPVLIMANKQDLPTAQTSENISQALHVQQMQQDRACAVFACTVKQDSQQLHQQQQQQVHPGLQQGLQWLVSIITPMFTQIQTKIDKEAAEARAIEQQHRQEREQRVILSR